MDEKLLILSGLIGLLLQPILIAVGILISKKESLKSVALCIYFLRCIHVVSDNICLQHSINATDSQPIGREQIHLGAGIRAVL